MEAGMEYTELKRELCRKVQERMGYMKEMSDEEVEETIDEVLLEQENLVTYPVEMRWKLKKELFDSLRRLDILQIFVEDNSVAEIMINGTEHIFIERKGKLQELDKGFDSIEKLQDVIQQIVAGCNRVVNEASPIVDARLPDGSRVNIVMKPVALNGPIVTIRRFPDKPITMDWLVKNHSISEQAALFLETLVKAGYNIFISGGTGSGKTTFLNALSQFIPPDERVITIEDRAE
ncbi:MAG: Flp pilus assembly complex ATPase component TadA, partial [Acetatifactor sp.]|nr:Flp pilus assembly complex ATPase component TadA [Acetatifactor sp.]